MPNIPHRDSNLRSITLESSTLTITQSARFSGSIQINQIRISMEDLEHCPSILPSCLFFWFHFTVLLFTDPIFVNLLKYRYYILARKWRFTSCISNLGNLMNLSVVLSILTVFYVYLMRLYNVTNSISILSEKTSV
jgi:hypothetical protein